MINKPWKPKKNQVYFYVNEMHEVDIEKWKGDFWDTTRLSSDNVFFSFEEATRKKELTTTGSK